jgi:CBS domain-containing protein
MLKANSSMTIVQEWMSHTPITIRSDETIRDALQLLGEKKVSALPVTNAEGLFVGIVTIADFLRAVIATDKVLDGDYPHFDDCLWAVDLIQRRLGSDKVSSVMTEVVSTISPEQTMHEAARVLIQNGVHHLPVVTSKGALVGVLSSSDFVSLVGKTSI